MHQLASKTSSQPRPTGSTPSWLNAIEHGFLVLVFMTVVGTFYLVGIMPVLILSVYVYAMYMAFRYPGAFLKAIDNNGIVLVFPILAFVSTLWSVDPATTLKNSVQLLYTGFIGLAIGARFPLRTVFICMTIAMVLCVLMSVANIYIELVPAYKEDDYVGAERYFLGLYPQKNMMGSVLYLCGLGLIYLGILYRKLVLAYIAALALVPLLLEAKSTTALLFYLVALTMPVAWWFFKHVRLKAVLLLSVTIIVCVLLFAAVAMEVALIDEFLGFFGKDRSLTGRTVIWAAAYNAFDRAPYFGIGYEAFWSASMFTGDVQLIRAAVLESIAGFHNGHLEVVVGTGMLGLLTYWLLIVWVVALAIRNLLFATNPTALVALYFVLLTTVKSFTESALVHQHDIDYLMFCIVCVRLNRRMVKKPIQRAQGVQTFSHQPRIARS